MCMINNVAKSWMKLETSVLENYKYATEGTGKTAGSYILTNAKSAITLGEKDPDMFRIQNMFRATPIVGAFTAGVLLASVGTLTIVKIKEHNNKTVEEKEND